MEAASEDVGLPDLAGIPFKLLQQVVHHVLGLLLVAHDGADGSLDVRPDHVDAGGAGLQPHAVPAALLHDLRLLQLQLVDAGDHDAVARLSDVVEGAGYLVVLRLHRRQLRQQAHQIPIIPHLKAGLLRQGLVEQLPGQGQPCGGHAGAQVDG